MGSESKSADKASKKAASGRGAGLFFGILLVLAVLIGAGVWFYYSRYTAGGTPRVGEALEMAAL